MASYVFRTCKVNCPNNDLYVFQRDSFNFAPSTTGDFKQYHENEYVIELGELDAQEMGFIANCLVMAERQLMHNQVHYMVSVFDFAHSFQIANDSPVMLLFPNSTTDVQHRNSAFWHYNFTYGLKTYRTSRTTVAQTRVLEYDETTAYYWKRLDQGITLSSYSERCLMLGQETDYGNKHKIIYYGCVSDSEVGINYKGHIYIPNHSELICTRLNRYNYYMRFVTPYMNSSYVDKDGYLQPGNFRYGPLHPIGVSDMKSQKHVYMGKSLYARKSKDDLVKFIMDHNAICCRAKEIIHIYGYTADLGLPTPDPMNRFTNWLRGLIVWLVSRFPYLANDIPLPLELSTSIEHDANKYLIPEFEYSKLQDIFNRCLSYYEYFLDFQAFYDKLVRGYGGGYALTTVTGSSGNSYSYYTATGSIAYKAQQIIDLDFLAENYYGILDTIINFQYVLGHFERLWDVRSYKASLNVKPARRVRGTKTGGAKYVTKRGFKESGVAFPRIAENFPVTVREKTNANISWRDATPAPVSASVGVFWLFSSYDLEKVPIEKNSIRVDGSWTGDPPTALPTGAPPKRKFVWDNTIHPLDPEDEDAEAIAMLEDVEENLRTVGHTEWGIAKVIAARYKIEIPPAVSGLVDLGIDYLVEGINPTDRPRFTILKVKIEFDENGRPVPYSD